MAGPGQPAVSGAVACRDSCQPRPKLTWEPLPYGSPNPAILLCLIPAHCQQGDTTSRARPGLLPLWPWFLSFLNLLFLQWSPPPAMRPLGQYELGVGRKH